MHKRIFCNYSLRHIGLTHSLTLSGVTDGGAEGANLPPPLTSLM